MRHLAITTGDPDGVGPEVTVKALLKMGPQSGVRFYIFRDSSSKDDFKKLNRKFMRVICSSLEEALTLEISSAKILVEIENDETAVDWVETAAKACLQKKLNGMITGPLSKTLIAETGRKSMGHTEILQRLAKVDQIFQGYLGKHFNVVLATAHTPLAKVSRSLTQERLTGSLKAALHLRELMTAKRKLPVGLLGLNPHAGEGGLIGNEEVLLRCALKKLDPREKQIKGPLVPDAAFAPENWMRYSVYVACYHDQGLIPFKMIHGKSTGTQISLGLPFVRTSVDHGTAKEIAGKNIADPGSMADSIDWCLRLTQAKKKGS